MKFTGLALTLVTSAVVVAFAQPAASNATGSLYIPSNSPKVDSARDMICRTTHSGVLDWWYNTYDNGPYFCYGTVNNAWAMINSYRSGGIEDVHWKYTDDPNDRQCLTDWEYYAEDGTTFIRQIGGRTTLERATRRWCALPVYRSGGVNAFQWGYCTCRTVASNQ